MARLRYVKTLDQVKQARETNPEFLNSTVQSIRCRYETDPDLLRAVVPKPLEVTTDPEMCVTFSHVAMHITPELTIEIGSGIFGVTVTYDGVEGIYLVTMPMTTEQAVVPGRETFGEPKKIAQIEFEKSGDTVGCTISRMGIPYLAVKGTIGADTGARSFTEHGYCYKALPACEKTRDFDVDPILVRLDWKHDQSAVHPVEGELVLTESPFDPVADLPVRRITRMEYEVGQTESNGQVLRTVPGEWLLPFLHQRYDDPGNPGIEVATS